jgi:hypothetical protein
MKIYKSVLKILKEKCKVAFPMDVKRVNLTKDDGYCRKEKNKFVIRIDRKLTENEAVEILLHEVAHALSWNYLDDKLSDEEFKKRSHGPTWGVAYAEVYSVYEENFL